MRRQQPGAKSTGCPPLENHENLSFYYAFFNDGRVFVFTRLLKARTCDGAGGNRRR